MNNSLLAPGALTVNADFPPKLQFLFSAKRYKVAYGGRGGAKSWGYARALILQMLQKPLRVLCARELQNSISESVHKLLSSQIEKMGLSGLFDILNTEIRCKATGGEFQFAGIRNNTDKIKSYEDFDICWVEEANKVTKTSWNILIPTIRKPASEIWISFNPELEIDYTYQHFVVHPRDNSDVVYITWRDNPWFPDVLRAEMEELKRNDLDAYLWVWEGKCRKMLEGAVYAKELRDADAEERICRVPYDRKLPVDVFFDLGHADSTSMWFRQYANFQFRYINYYEASQFHIDHYLAYMQNMGYIYGTVWLPHDAKSKTVGTKLSVREQIMAKGYRTRIVPNLRVYDGINAARTVFPNSWFDQAACRDGLQCLMHYRYEKNDNTGRLSEDPVHDQYSHGADAFRYSAVASKEPRNPNLNTSLVEAASGKIRNLGRALASSLGDTGWMR
jgi:phage terminase large subunit